MGGEHNDATSGTITICATHASAVTTADNAAAAVADAGDGALATNAARGAVWYTAGITTNEYADASIAV